MEMKIVLKATLIIVTLGAYLISLIKENIGRNNDLKPIRI